jgi:glycosyltransferase involved in cell wall biosynthesis
VKRQNYILWLPSWYPNEREPYSGDFIQRHAKAASLNNNITVIFFTQFGETVSADKKVLSIVSGNLKEVLVYVPFKPYGFRAIDRIWYNLVFYSFAIKFLKSYFKENGLPLLVHVHVPVKAGNLALWIKNKFQIPYIVSEQASTYLKQAGDYFFKRRHWLYRANVKKIFSKASAVTNVSFAIGKILQELFSITYLQVIHNVVDTTIFCPDFSQKDRFTYIHVSSLNDQKNISGILRVFKEMANIRADWKFIIVGPHTEEIRGFIEKERLGHLIELVGEVPYVKVASFTKLSHAMVLFSKHENFPCVVVEALCCGIPVVASDVAGLKDCVKESNGILVESENENELLKALIRIRENYGDYDRTSIAEDAARTYSYQTISKQFDRLYKEIITKH